jgi:hypothetical protein
MEHIFILGVALIEWIGYLASLLVLISLSLSSIVRLRLFNLAGASIFSFYGFYIGSLPVGIMNLIIVFANIYYLRQLYFKKEMFDVTEINPTDTILRKFINYYYTDIKEFFPDFNYEKSSDDYTLLVLRDLNFAGVIMGEKTNNREFRIKLDYVPRKYRDYKLGKYIFTKFSDIFKEKGIEKLTCRSEIKKHQKYLKKVGFKEKNENLFYMEL